MQIINESLKRLHTDWFQLCNILEKETTDIYMYVIYIYFTAPQILPGAQGKGGRDE